MGSSMEIKKPQGKKPNLTDAERQKRFVEMAKKIEASEDLDDFGRAFDSLSIRPQAPSGAEIRPQRNLKYDRKS